LGSDTGVVEFKAQSVAFPRSAWLVGLIGDGVEATDDRAIGLWVSGKSAGFSVGRFSAYAENLAPTGGWSVGAEGGLTTSVK